MRAPQRGLIAIGQSQNRTRRCVGVAAKAAGMRRQGFFGAAMLPMSELEYTGIVEKLATLDGRFTVRA